MNDRNSFSIIEKIPTIGEYQKLRMAMGWPVVDERVVEIGLRAALYSVCLCRDGDIIGCGRVVGDGGIYFYIQDIIVLPEFQGQGWGNRIMEKVMDYIKSHAGENSFIGLMAAEGVIEFYHRYGFSQRPPDRPGMFRMWKKTVH